MVKVDLEVLGQNGASRQPEKLEVLVDTGATLTVLPGKLLERMGIEPIRNQDGSVKMINAILANGQTVERKVAEARLRLEGQEVTTRIIFGTPDDAALLGVIVLETLGLAVDPVSRRLVPTDYLLL